MTREERELLEDNGWTVACESPPEIFDAGNSVSGHVAVGYVIEALQRQSLSPRLRKNKKQPPQIHRPYYEGDMLQKSILSHECPCDDGLTGPGYCGGKLVPTFAGGDVVKCEKCDMRWSPVLTPLCPTCGRSMVRVVYGSPSPTMSERAKAGEIVLGGCCSPNPDQYQCLRC
jgi:hypothetical protein